MRTLKLLYRTLAMQTLFVSISSKNLLTTMLWGILICQFQNLNAQDKNSQEIRQVLEKQQIDWNKGRIEEFMQGYWHSDKLVFVGKSGLTWGWEPVLNNYQKNYDSPEKRGTLNFEIYQIKPLNPNNAYVIGKWKIERKNEIIQGHFLLIFQKIKKQWKIIADHTS